MTDKTTGKKEVVDRLLLQIIDALNDARGIPFKKELCIADREHLLDLAESAYDNLPADIAEARKIIQERDHTIADAEARAKRTVADAEAQADRIKNEAREMAKRMVEENEIVTGAKKRAKEIFESNEQKVNELKSEAISYVDEKLSNASSMLEQSLGDIKNIRKSIHTDTPARD
ncbi:MAG: hypothetical protein J5849_00735 [Clostridia bacterium]|nr:hypothetical protein [Clostridia bacterium]